MISIIVGLLIALILFVVIISAIQQHKEKQGTEKKTKVAKHKAILDESETLLQNLSNLPSSSTLITILNKRSLNAAKTIQALIPNEKGIGSRVQELSDRLDASESFAANQPSEENLIIPNNEQQILTILQCIKKLRVTIKSEHSKGIIDDQTFSKEDQRLDAMQLKINIESLLKRGNQAHSKQMTGSARQYFEKALQTLAAHPMKTDYVATKQSEISNLLSEIGESLKNTNAKDVEKKSKTELDGLEVGFQPKKKW